MINDYVLDVGENAYDRLDLVDLIYGTQSRFFLEKIPLKKNMNVISFGCGLGNIERWMAEQVGENGKVVAYDQSIEQLDIARRRAADHGLNNLEFIQADVTNLSLFADFDIAYCRFLLMHLKNPSAVIQTMINSLKPGGIIILEEVAHNTAFSFPDDHLIKKAVGLMDAFSKLKNLDYDIGFKVFDLTHKQNIKEIQIKAHQPVFYQGEEKGLLLKSLFEASKNLVQNQIISSFDLNKLLSELNSLVNNPNSIVSVATVYQLYGRK